VKSKSQEYGGDNGVLWDDSIWFCVGL